MTPTRFDIYVRQDNRWQLKGSMPGEDKDAALAKGASMDSSGEFQGVRLMAVTEYGEGRAPLETLAWISPHLSNVAAVTHQMKRQASAASQNVAARVVTEPNAGYGKRPKAPSTIAPSGRRETDATSPFKITTPAPASLAQQLAGKVAINTVISIVIAVVAFVVISILTKNFGAAMGMSATAQGKAAFGVSGIVFVIAAAFLLGKVYRAHVAALPEMTAERRAQLRRNPDRNLKNPRPRQSRDRAAEPQQQSQELQATERVSAAQADVMSTVPEENPKPAGGLTQKMRRAMLEFLAKSLAAIAGEVPTVNRHVSFGLNLFISGAAERYAKHVSLSPMQGFVLVREMVEALGNAPDRVDEYCRQYSDYKSEERYGLMIAAGNAVMSRYVEDDPDPFSDFADVIQMWTSDAAARAQVQGIVCIMFTDLVGSTQMTHERGDYGAQEVVRIHNAIVRSSLAAHRGREVKHTGDGIMASFASSADATRAGLEMQQAFADHNARNSALQVRVRIGLNAGEAVEEEDDFFGTTVQVAARVCDKGDTGDVFVTDNVRELSRAHNLLFEEAGQYEMKGVPQPLTLYRARLSEKAV